MLDWSVEWKQDCLVNSRIRDWKSNSRVNPLSSELFRFITTRCSVDFDDKIFYRRYPLAVFFSSLNRVVRIDPFIEPVITFTRISFRRFYRRRPIRSCAIKTLLIRTIALVLRGYLFFSAFTSNSATHDPPITLGIPFPCTFHTRNTTLFISTNWTYCDISIRVFNNVHGANDIVLQKRCTIV